MESFLTLFSSFPYTGTETSDQRYWVSALLKSQNTSSLPIIDVDYQNHLVASISKSSWDMLTIEDTRGHGKNVGIRDLMGSPVILHLPNNKDKLRHCYEKLISPIHLDKFAEGSSVGSSGTRKRYESLGDGVEVGIRELFKDKS